jgi:hypothetical protein
MIEVLIIGHIAATWFMIGLIWTMQIVHYPLWIDIGKRESANYHGRHTRRIGWLVGIVGGVEFLTGSALLALIPDALSASGMSLLTTIWLVTAFVQMPLHKRLGSYWSDSAIHRLIRGNWIRTLLWSMRGSIALALIWR